MRTCSECGERVAKSELKNKICGACQAAKAMASTMEENPMPADAVKEMVAKMMGANVEMPSAEEASKMCHVVERDGRKFLTAARDFAEGSLVLRESPSLLWHAEDVPEILPNFLAASPEAQQAVLDMAVPDIDAGLDRLHVDSIRDDVLQQRRQRREAYHSLALQVAEDYEGSSRIVELMEALLQLADCYSHAIEGQVGLFPLAALANHSCEPSCGHSTCVGSEIRFYATRLITAGEEITISRIPEAWAAPRDSRHVSLLLQRLVYCCCERCVGNDGNRGLPCPMDGCDGAAEQADARAYDKEASWHCCACRTEHSHEAMRPQLEAEATLAQRITTHLASPSASTADDLRRDAASVREQLSPSHHLGVQALAGVVSTSPPPDARALAAAATHELAILECAGAHCHSRQCARAGVTQHPARAELVAKAATAALACVATKSKDLLAVGGVIASRYLPWAMRQFGPEDHSVKTMQILLKLIASSRQASQTATPAGTVERTMEHEP